MGKMGKYCKAYPATQLRQFPKWVEKVPPLRVTKGAQDSGNGASDEEEYYYLHDNYIVTAGVFQDESIAFSEVTEEWIEFCKNSLNFRIPSRTQEGALN